MSRHELTPLTDLIEKHPGATVGVGWETSNTMRSGSWFLQVAATDDVGFPFEWIFGSTIEEALFTNPAQLVAEAKRYAIVEPGLVETLLADKVRETQSQN
jgi:hypothetical protein